MGKEAYLFVNSGTYYVVEYPSQRIVCRSINANRAIRRARRLGYDVRVYTRDGSRVYRALVEDDHD